MLVVHTWLCARSSAWRSTTFRYAPYLSTHTHPHFDIVKPLYAKGIHDTMSHLLLYGDMDDPMTMPSSWANATVGQNRCWIYSLNLMRVYHIYTCCPGYTRIPEKKGSNHHFKQQNRTGGGEKSAHSTAKNMAMVGGGMCPWLCVLLRGRGFTAAAGWKLYGDDS